jgi:hypothetical protein
MPSTKYSAFSLVEVLITLFCVLLILAPSMNYLFSQLKITTHLAKQTELQQQANYILMLIGDELQFSKLNSDWIPQEGSSEQSLLAFTRNDGKYVRYYLRSQEIVKDYNYSVYNAISTKLFKSFRIKRTDNEKMVNLSVKITGNTNEVFQQSWNIAKP